jgi:hypothetical protein
MSDNNLQAPWVGNPPEEKPEPVIFDFTEADLEEADYNEDCEDDCEACDD